MVKYKVNKIKRNENFKQACKAYSLTDMYTKITNMFGPWFKQLFWFPVCKFLY